MVAYGGTCWTPTGGFNGGWNIEVRKGRSRWRYAIKRACWMFLVQEEKLLLEHGTELRTLIEVMVHLIQWRATGCSWCCRGRQ
jgi:hypothetical protein